MIEMGAIFFSWQFFAIGLLVAFLVSVLLKVGVLLWKIQWKWLRQCLVFLDGVSPWLPPFFGGAIGAIPQLPRPGILVELPEGLGYAAMILLGVFAGSLYERIWKGVKQIMEAKGLKLDKELPPKAQKKAAK